MRLQDRRLSLKLLIGNYSKSILGEMSDASYSQEVGLFSASELDCLGIKNYAEPDALIRLALSFCLYQQGISAFLRE